MIKEAFDYIVRLSNISVWYYVAAIGIGALVGAISKKWKISVLIGYMIIVFSIAVLSRRTKNYSLNFELFYKYQQGFNEQILSNILLFIPIGLLLASIRWKLVPIGIVFSVLIELSQLCFKRGIFDIVSNSLGIMTGILLITFFRIAKNAGGQ